MHSEQTLEDIYNIGSINDTVKLLNQSEMTPPTTKSLIAAPLTYGEVL